MTRRLVLGGVGLAIVAGAILALALRRPAPPPRPSAARLEELRIERDRLPDRLRATVVENGERSLAQAPPAGLMIGLPVTFASAILEQTVTGVFGRTVLTLRDLKVHKAGTVKAKVLFAKPTLGKYKLDLRIHRVRGLLEPGLPAVTFGRDRVGLDLPVRLASGDGTADLRFRWDSKGLANLVCGDVDITRAITGGVSPRDYSVSGHFAIKADGETIVLRPSFPDLAVRIFVDPSEQAWAVVDEVIRDRPKGCEIALDKVDVKDKLASVLGRGFRVRIPQRIFKPIRMPAGIRQSLELQGLKLALAARPTGVLVADDRIWYGADVSIRSGARRHD